MCTHNMENDSRPSLKKRHCIKNCSNVEGTKMIDIPWPVGRETIVSFLLRMLFRASPKAQSTARLLSEHSQVQILWQPRSDRCPLGTHL